MGVTGGSTDVSVWVRILDASDGTPEQGVTSATAGLNFWYCRVGGTVTNLTESDLAAIDSAHSDGAFIHADDGWYRVCYPDAAFAAGVRGVQIGGAATDMVVFGPYVEIDPPVDVTKISGDSTAADNLESACDNYSATRGLAGTALPAAAADAAGGLPISDAGGLDLDALDTNVDSILADTGTDGVKIAADAITASAYDESTAFPVKSADTGATQIARVGADGDTLETLSDQLDAVETDTGEIGAAGAGLTALGDARLANLDAAVTSRSSHSAADVWSVGTRTLTSFGTLAADAATAVWAAGARTLTSYGTLAADTATAVWAAVTRTLTSGAAPAAADVADAVWDEALAGHAVAGSAGEALSAAGGAADPLLNAVPGSYAGGTAGAALGRIGSGQITTVSTVAQSGDMTEIIAGADYLAADGYQFDWTDASAAWPTLTGAAIEWEASGGGQTYTASGSVVTPTGASKKVRLELTAAQTTAIAALHTGAWAFVVWATLASGSVIPLVQGSVPVKDTPGP